MPVMDRASIVEHREYASAEEFLHALQPGEQTWQEGGPWAFRGHADAEWSLVPSILRRERWKEYLTDAERRSADGPLRRFLLTQGEKTAVFQFIRLADRSGLAVPGDSQNLRLFHRLIRMLLQNSRENDPLDNRFPPDELLTPMALAQHHGVPTRLLDWTWRSRVAAYFAAAGSVESSQVPGAHLCVWALNTAFVNGAWAVVMSGDPPPDVCIVTAPQAGNTYLAAQAGVFSLDRTAQAETDDLGTCVERKVSTLREQSRHLRNLPALVRLKLPRSEAPKLLRLLSYEEVSPASIYPDYSGVVRALRERLRWDDVPGPVDLLR